MPDIPAACVTSSHHPVTAALFPSGSNPLIGNAIYQVTSPGAKTQGSCYGGGYISPATLAATVLIVLPAQYRAAVINSATGSGGNSYYPCYIPSGL
jgi:hypothetical protein